MSEGREVYFGKLEDLFIFHTNGSVGEFGESFLHENFELKSHIKSSIKITILYPLELGLEFYQSFLKNYKVGDEYNPINDESFTLEQRHMEYIENKLKTTQGVYNLIKPLEEELEQQIQFDKKTKGDS